MSELYDIYLLFKLSFIKQLLYSPNIFRLLQTFLFIENGKTSPQAMANEWYKTHSKPTNVLFLKHMILICFARTTEFNANK